jgi:hypothetical protein
VREKINTKNKNGDIPSVFTQGREEKAIKGKEGCNQKRITDDG